MRVTDENAHRGHAVTPADGLQTDAGAWSPVFHGFRGAAAPSAEFSPQLSIAINRQTGARGRQVAERVAEILGFTYYAPETIDLAAHDPNPPSLLDAAAARWVASRTAELGSQLQLDDHADLTAVVRVLLDVAANGSAVLVGKGSTVVLPAASCVRVRIVAPEPVRAAYIAQWERMSHDEALQYVRQREAARHRWLADLFGVDQNESETYDLVLNSADLGVEGCARALAAAAQCKAAALANGEAVEF